MPVPSSERYPAISVINVNTLGEQFDYTRIPRVGVSGMVNALICHGKLAGKVRELSRVFRGNESRLDGERVPTSPQIPKYYGIPPLGTEFV